MDIEDFIKARLVSLESNSRNNQMVVNNLDVTRHLRLDAQATRELLKNIYWLEEFANTSDDAFAALEYVGNMRRVIASRWSDHKDFKREWLVR